MIDIMVSKSQKETVPRRCRTAYVSLFVIGLAALAQALILAYGIYEAYDYRNRQRPLGFIFEPLQLQHWFNLFWFWPITVLALVTAIAVSAPSHRRSSCTRYVGWVTMLTLLMVPTVSYFSHFAWEAEVWRLLSIYLVYGSLVIWLGIRGYVRLK